MSLGLGQRIAFSLGALLVYHVGTYIPIPGIDSSLWLTLFRGHGSSPLSMFYANDAVHRLSILALGIFPYLSAAVVVQLLSLLLLRTRAESSPRRTGDRYVLALTATFAALQASGIAFGLERVPGLVSEPGWLFRTSTIVSGGSFFLIWLSGLITARGVGNGLALLLFAGIATDIPAGVASLVDLAQRGVVSSDFVMFVALATVAAVACIVFIELARRNLPIQYVSWRVGDRIIAGGPSHLSLKLNSAGLIPAVVASWLLSIVPRIVDFANRQGLDWLRSAAGQFSNGRPGFMLLAVVLIVFLSLLYTAFLIDPERAAEKLTRYGGLIPGRSPGEATVEHIDHTLSRIAAFGACYLALVYVLPEILIPREVTFYFSGISFLILVCTVLDIDMQVRGGGLNKIEGIRQ
jgi:preprotein translocase subunit SecY